MQPLPWRDYCWDSPYAAKVRPDEMIEVWRDDDSYGYYGTGRIRLGDMPPQANVAGLLWRRIASD